MPTNDFEKAFNDFFMQYHHTADALLSLVRSAFAAGWLAAGGKEPMLQCLFPEAEKETTPPQ